MLVASLALFALSAISFVGAWKIPLAVLIAVGLGVAIASIMVPAQTLLQEKTPSWFRGRIYSSLSFLLIVGTSIPLLTSAAISDIFGVAVMIGAVAAAILLSLLFIKREGDYVLAHGFGI